MSLRVEKKMMSYFQRRAMQIGEVKKVSDMSWGSKEALGKDEEVVED